MILFDIYQILANFMDVFRYFAILWYPLCIYLPPSSSLTFVMLTWLITSSWIVTYCPTRNLELSGICIGMDFFCTKFNVYKLKSIFKWTLFQVIQKKKELEKIFYVEKIGKIGKILALLQFMWNNEKWHSARQSNNWHLPICNRGKIQFNHEILF